MRNKLKPKVPTRSGPATLWLEIVFFVGLGVLGFALVTALLPSGGSAMIAFDPSRLLGVAADPAHQEQPETVVIALYGARSKRPLPEPTLSPIFTPSVQYWKEDILRWSAEYGVDPNLIATVMQIESCGYPLATSRSGAMGLFQVMPFHFAPGEKPYDPDTNALRGITYLARGLEISGGHAGLALAGYNGGHSVINRSYETWSYETKRYYRWGSGIYREASAGWDSSPTLAAWYAVGGRSLCTQAEQYLGITSP